MFHNLEDTLTKNNINTSNMKLYDIPIQKNFSKIIYVGFSTWIRQKILASYEVLDYFKYFYGKDVFYRKSLKLELTFKIQNNLNCDTKSHLGVLLRYFS